MWPGAIQAIEAFVRAALASDGSFNVTLVGGATGGSTVAQGDPQSDATKPWLVKLQLGNTAITIGRQAAADSVPVVLSDEDKTALDGIGTATAAGATAAKQDTAKGVLDNILTALSDASQLAGVLGVDGATIASSTNGLPVVDALLTGAGQGTTTAGASAAVATGMTGGGRLYVKNTDASTAAYLTFDGSAASNTKFLLEAGASIGIPIADVTDVLCYSAGTPVLSWAFFTA